MSAVTRWVEYPIDGGGEASVVSQGLGGIGQRGYSMATGATDKDMFSIGAGNNRLYVNFDGQAPSPSTPYVTLTSGVDLDPRFVARDITERLHNLGRGTEAYDFAQCVWENNRLRLYSGTLGNSSSVVVVSGSQTAHLELGWGTQTNPGGTNNNLTGSTNDDGGYDGGILVSGTYNGFFDEEYTIVVGHEGTINAELKGGSNNYTGTMTVGGVYNANESITYTIFINVQDGANGGGTTMGGGIGNVPRMTWSSSTGTDDCPSPVDLLYPNYWYKVGTKGLMVKFSDAVFSHCPDVDEYAWTVACDKSVNAFPGGNTFGSPGSAYYLYGSTRGDDSGDSSVLSATAGNYTQLGSRGLSIAFTSTAGLHATDEFRVICKPPQPKSYDITNLNYGNVTVSTEAPVKAVIFEIMSGAIEMSTVKFGLQSHGTFEHHNENNDDTFFRFGTVGPGNTAGSNPVDGLEWREGVLASDISNDVAPSYLAGTKENLNVVSDADDSESIGASSYMGMTSDPIWLNIKLGASEVGANSTINYRIFFDYS
jgi:hypothetical protein